MKFWSLLLVALLAFATFDDADAARRLGGGGSIGRQSSNVTQRQAGQQPAAPAGVQQASPQQPAPAAQPAPSRPWGGILGGLAAGLGLAWLAHSLGLGAGFGQFLMLALLALVAFAVIGAVMRRRAHPAHAMAYSGQASPVDAAAAPRQYNPDKVGNDASARPWERSSMAFDSAKYNQGAATGGIRIGSGLQGAQNWGVPAGFDTDGFLAASKRNFVTLQDAWDRADMTTLRSMMTDEMLGEIRKQLAGREPGSTGRTEVALLEAQLLGIEETAADYLASVEFSGMIREEPSAGPAPFREVWNMVKPKDGATGWLVAGVQALQ